MSSIFECYHYHYSNVMNTINSQQTNVQKSISIESDCYEIVLV